MVLEDAVRGSFDFILAGLDAAPVVGADFPYCAVDSKSQCLVLFQVVVECEAAGGVELGWRVVAAASGKCKPRRARQSTLIRDP